MRHRTRSLIAINPLERMVSKSDSGVRLIRPFSVSMTKKSSSVNFDTGSIAAMLSVFLIGSTYGDKCNACFQPKECTATLGKAAKLLSHTREAGIPSECTWVTQQDGYLRDGAALSSARC